MWCQTFISQLRNRRYFSQIASTIFALSSGQGKCGVAVVRVSGVKAAQAIWKMTNINNLPDPRMAILKNIRDPETMEKLDRGLILWFPGPNSFTGEDCCEFQVHGGIAVVSSVLSALGKLRGFRPAEPGEFARRAFFNGKLDLSEIEGLGDLINAETEMQRKQALLEMDGVHSNLYKKWRKELLNSVAHIEAFIDFSEDENIEHNVLQLADSQLQSVKKEIEKYLAGATKGERLRHGVRTTIVGEPNAGKSSLLNLLCERPAAIVTPIPGTTRDLIETNITLNGYPLILTDTAGLRNESNDMIELEGISRTLKILQTCDLFLIVMDSTNIQQINKSFPASNEELSNLLMKYLIKLNIDHIICEKDIVTFEGNTDSEQKNLIFVLNKIDLLNDNFQSQLVTATQGTNIICMSCKTLDGLSLLTNILTEKLKQLCASPSRENPVLTQVRHRHHLMQCCYYLDQYLQMSDLGNLPSAAYQIRKGLNQIGKITGEVHTEEILDIVFRDFCIALAKWFSTPAGNICQSSVPHYMLFSNDFQDTEIRQKIINDMRVYENYITSKEELSLLAEIEPLIKRQRYESHHWDLAIKHYREKEIPHWNTANAKVIDNIKKLAFDANSKPLKCVHVLDLRADGFIAPHIDSVKFCGNTIAGLSLSSDSVMRLRLEKEKSVFVDVLLKRMSLYIMTGSARYDFTHEILNQDSSKFGDEKIIKTRRVSVICRNEP